jgi:hypothetical protein
MTYALLLLAIMAVIAWSFFGGMTLPSGDSPNIDPGGVQARIESAVRHAYGSAQSAARNMVRNQLHKAVDEALEEEEK